MLTIRESLTPAARRLPLTRQLAAWAELHGLDQTGLAREAGYSQGYVCQALKGRRAAPEVLAAIERLTGIKAGELAAAIRVEAGSE